jgi:ferritin-like metal-binding protein YciE
MAESARDAKLTQYLTEAYGKEKELETALAAHISLTSRVTYKKRLQQHLRETKGHARQVERRLKKLGGGGVSKALAEIASRGVATAKGPLHALRAAGVEERMLKNAKTEYSEEHEEIATYVAIEALAEEVGDSETAKLARSIRREEERMASFLERQIPVLTRAVAKAQIPSSERRGGRSRARRRPARRRTGRSPARRSGRRRGPARSR